MQDTDLFQLALGLSSPWTVTRSEFDAVDGRLDFVEFPRGSRFACAQCGREGCAVHDTKEDPAARPGPLQLQPQTSRCGSQGVSRRAPHQAGGPYGQDYDQEHEQHHRRPVDTDIQPYLVKVSARLSAMVVP